MGEPAPGPPTIVDEPVSLAGLHGEACFYCGSVHKTMHAAGAVTLVGHDRVRLIVT